MGIIYELINKHISKELYKKMPCKKKMETDYYPKAFGLLGYKQTWGGKMTVRNFKQ